MKTDDVTVHAFFLCRDAFNDAQNRPNYIGLANEFQSVAEYPSVLAGAVLAATVTLARPSFVRVALVRRGVEVWVGAPCSLPAGQTHWHMSMGQGVGECRIPAPGTYDFQLRVDDVVASTWSVKFAPAPVRKDPTTRYEEVL